MQTQVQTNEIPLLVATVGLPGSGKSTAAKKLSKLGFEVVCPDEVRSVLLGQPNDDVNPKPFDLKREPEVWGIVGQRVCKLLEEGKNVVLDATHVTKWDREQAIVWAMLSGAHISFLVMPFQPEVCFERRGHQMPRDVLERMVATYEEPTPDEGPVAYLA